MSFRHARIAFVLGACLFTFAPVVQASELIAHWKFDESSGNADDSSNNLPDLTNSNVTYSTGQYGNAAYFNGSTSFFSGTGPNLNGQSFTFSAWLWRETGGGQEIYFSQGSGDGSHNNLHLRVYDDGLMRFGFLNNDLDAPSGTFVMGQWNHVVLTYDAGTNARRIYVNGGAAKASDTSASDFIGNTDLNIGRWIRNGGDQYWTGRIDDLKIYNRALTQDEITDIAEGGAGPGLLGVDTFSPADNATNVSTTANLVATFSTTTVATSTGSVGIYTTSGDTLVESISVSSAQITKSGADITINPSVTLADSTGYYVWIPSTAFKDADDVFYEGTTASTTWSFTTGDFTSPTPSSVTASSTASTTAGVGWTTSEAASTKVVFGLTTNYSSTTPEKDISPRVTSHYQRLAPLAPCTTYHYAAVSRDAAGNSATSSDATFTTEGCEYDATPTSATSTPVTSSSGGSTDIEDDGKTFTVTAPADATATSSSFVIQVKAIPSDDVLSSLGRPGAKPNEVGTTVFDVKAIINGTTILDSFDAEVTIEYEYTDEEVSSIDESTLWLYHYTGGAWVALNDCTVNTAANTISCTTPSFSIFGLFGSQSQSSSNSSSIGGGGTTIQGRVANLLASGNTALAQQLMREYPQAFAASAAVAVPMAAGGCPKYHFTRYLKKGMTGEDVRVLQQLMNCLGFKLGESGPGAPGEETNLFAQRTFNAVVKFQEAYHSDILVPIGAEQGTGFFAMYSMKKAHALLGVQ